MDFLLGLYPILIIAAAIVAFRAMISCSHWLVKITVATQIIASLILLTKIQLFIVIAEWLYVLTLFLLLIYSISTLKTYLSVAIVLPVFIFNVFRLNHWPFAGTLGWLCTVSVIAYLTLGFRDRSKTLERGLFAITAADALVAILMRIQ